jgi:colicin import membrane protein
MAAKSKAVRKSTRLKVFMTQIGFHNWLVAAPSQKAALEAWDVKENLFAIGAAQVVTDKDCIELAMKTPGVPVPVDAGHTLAKVSKVLRLDDHPKRKAGRRPAEPKKAPPPRPKKADRSKLDRAEKALEDFRKRGVRERNAILRAQKELDLKAAALEDELDAEEERLEQAVEDAADDYDKQVS